MASVTRTHEIVNVKGLHARASAKFVETVEEFDAEAQVSKDGLSTGGDSIMGLLMLAASKGTTIDVTTTGADAAALADAIEALIKDRFGEDM
ncbi:HPr family phosphocarrier protein [Celeribacter ethanolicus]|uniref:HPr family phosphocarrier protein n=1 Tax=Celeribacter ethanolicus TaxID=1758178 RepID=A0A291GEV4_9RHOB|nr:HPr family phosphocarrier protein [Celeribacter ethanolicus]ATG48735.1 HPr family phosphocarrier protein [Celeribacter ethanolicus]TNE68050.1 MAG: HPr family phosphocarrier protein [Paracoccaceae bacterium]